MAKGVSAEEKRQKVLSIFREDKDFYTLKDMEKIANKRKGINPQLVKDILNELVGDDLVKTEKIGLSNFFWSFPSQSLVAKKNLKTKLTEENQKLHETETKLTERIETEIKMRMSEERMRFIDEYEELKKQIHDVDDELVKFVECDPDKYEEYIKQAENFKNEANKITDKIFDVQSYVATNFNLERSEFLKNFNIDEDLDYI